MAFRVEAHTQYDPVPQHAATLEQEPPGGDTHWSTMAL
jgi:hypothetical protein